MLFEDNEPLNSGNEEQDSSKYDPTPDAISDNGKKMWIIKDYKIWADTYQQALKLLPLIEDF